MAAVAEGLVLRRATATQRDACILPNQLAFRVEPRPKALVSVWGYGDIVGAWYSRPDPFYCRQPAVPEADTVKPEDGKRKPHHL